MAPPDGSRQQRGFSVRAPHTNSTQEKAPVQRGNFSATTTKHGYDHNLIGNESKAFFDLESKFARAGHKLSRTTTIDGGVIYLASKWGYVKELRSLETVAAFLALIGGVK